MLEVIRVGILWLKIDRVIKFNSYIRDIFVIMVRACKRIMV